MIEWLKGWEAMHLRGMGPVKGLALRAALCIPVSPVSCICVSPVLCIYVSPALCIYVSPVLCTPVSPVLCTPVSYPYHAYIHMGNIKNTAISVAVILILKPAREIQNSCVVLQLTGEGEVNQLPHPTRRLGCKTCQGL